VIVVAGESLVDLILDPARGVEAVSGGGPFNTARTIARLGGSVAFLGRISSDRFGSQARMALERDGVDTSFVEHTDDPTTLAVAELDADGSATYRFYVQGTAAAGLSESAIPAVLASHPAAIHVGTLGLVLEPLATTIEALVARLDPATLLMLDVNARPTATQDAVAFRRRVERLIGRADVIKVSEPDLAFLSPSLAPDAALARLASTATGAVLCTAGPGPLVVAVGEARRALPVPTVRVVDTVGAGDAFGGGFLHAWMGAGGGRDGLRDQDAVAAAAEVGIRVAALTVGRAGAEPPWASELAVPA
jgi:fructokinase